MEVLLEPARPSPASVARGKMLRLVALFSALSTLAVPAAQANTEIRNFGPVLCRADEYGHLAAKAADQLAADWPILRPKSTPSTFSIAPTVHANLSDSEAGAWLVLDLSDNGKFNIPSPLDASLYMDLNPRDRWIRQTLDRVAWTFTKRFTVRSSIAANLAVEVHLELLDPEEVLKRGGVEWEAELVDTSRIALPSVGMPVTSSIPNHAVISSAVPRETGTPARKSSIQVGGSDDTVVFKRPQTSTLPSAILASDTINLSDVSPPRFPCDRIYLHLIPVSTGVSIPYASQHHKETKSDVWFWLNRLAERIYSDLVNEASKASSKTLPIHLTLEPLVLGVLPHTAVTMTSTLLVMVAFAYLGLRGHVNKLVEGF
ncbi:hypothetical protein BCV70DRAFT_18478 [Testicularia cyperi]|uniref:Protein PBN1 n=1 Tax=Testicularia cyperi TaxID=1882483 RepID=A0A317Y1R0_9BASI|nr:hypothetical protein BCV70DRAFT_18478 [Testicularia cyperi]